VLFKGLLLNDQTLPFSCKSLESIQFLKICLKIALETLKNNDARTKADQRSFGRKLKQAVGSFISSRKTGKPDNEQFGCQPQVPARN
jgi:hypothetical protein